MNIELPPELKLLEPLLNEMGYEWSALVRSGNTYQAWCVVNSSTRKAGRVGMSVAEAQEHVIAMARARLKTLKQTQEQTRDALAKLLGVL